MSTKTLIENRARELWDDWQEALAVVNNAYESHPRNDRIEQEAYDDLVDFVESHDLNYTEFDPRGDNSNDYYENGGE